MMDDLLTKDLDLQNVIGQLSGSMLVAALVEVLVSVLASALWLHLNQPNNLDPIFRRMVHTATTICCHTCTTSHQGNKSLRRIPLHHTGHILISCMVDARLTEIDWGKALSLVWVWVPTSVTALVQWWWVHWLVLVLVAVLVVVLGRVLVTAQVEGTANWLM
jgi:cell division protein FtsW (lipid II flippase)